MDVFFHNNSYTKRYNYVYYKLIGNLIRYKSLSLSLSYFLYEHRCMQLVWKTLNSYHYILHSSSELFVQNIVNYVKTQ